MPICLRNINPLLALYCHPNDPVAGTVLPPGQTAAMLAADSDLTVAALPAVYRYFAAPACSQPTFTALPAANRLLLLPPTANRLLLLPPAAKPTPYCLPIAP